MAAASSIPLDTLERAALVLSAVINCARQAYSKHNQPLNDTYSGFKDCQALLQANPDLVALLKSAHEAGKYATVHAHALFKSPQTPIQNTFPQTQLLRTPPAQDGDIDKKVNQILEVVRPFVRRYLDEDSLFPTCKSSSDDPRIVDRINALRIPMVGASRPELVLHRLGEDVVDQTIVDNVFTGTNTCLINTSRSGKTRILFEGLWKHWGFYFACARELLGSKDLETVLRQIQDTRSLTNNLVQPIEAHLQYNRKFARRRFLQTFTARWFVLRMFLEEASKTSRTPTSGSLDGYRKHWLILQLLPVTVCRMDVFADISTILGRASDEYLGVEDSSLGPAWELRASLLRYLHEGPFFIVVDEAQIPANSSKCSFRSEIDPQCDRTLLRELVDQLQMDGCTIILAGTGLSIKDVHETVQTCVMKGESKWRDVTHTGAFDSPDEHSSYLLRYLPPHLTETPSGGALIRRAWSWLRGRHRFTAAFVEMLVADSFRSPHKLLDKYIFNATSIMPPDTPTWAESEPELTRSIAAKIRRLPFVNLEKITNDQDIHHRFADIIYSWMLRRQSACLHDSEKEWIELGFARFHTRPGRPQDLHACREQIVVDEPLIILAAAQYLNAHTTFGLHDHVLNKVNHAAAGQGTHFEEFLAVYFAQAFGPTVRLCDLFCFGDNVPIWAKSLIEVFVPPATFPTVQWELQAAFPVIFRQRIPLNGSKIPAHADGSIICVIIQAKFHSQLRLSKINQADAVSTLNPSDFYRNDKLTREAIHDSVRGLSKINDEKWFPGQLPFLRVLATFPAEPAREEDAPVVTLNMDYCIEKMDKENALVNLIAALVPSAKRGNDQVGGPVPKKF